MAARFVLSVVVLVALCNVKIHARSVPAPPPPTKPPTTILVEDRNATIVQQSEEFNPDDNSFTYSFESSNGIVVKGYAKDQTVVVEGSYYINKADGTPTQVKYTADETGFHVVSDALPTPHPEIVKIIEYFRTLPPPTEAPEDLEKTL